MTDDERHLRAGSLLDAAVHTRVFGRQLGAGDYEDLPAYSGDLLASFEVAEFLRGQGYTVDVDTWTGGAAVVRLRDPVEEEQSYVGATPAEAICRAALDIVSQRDG
jgi:hypothetical protein